MKVEREGGKRVDLSEWNLPAIDEYYDKVTRSAVGIEQAAKSFRESFLGTFYETVLAAAGEALTTAFTEDYVYARLDDGNPLRLLVTVLFSQGNVDPRFHVDLEAIIKEELDDPCLDSKEEEIERFIAIRNALDRLRLMVDERIKSGT